MAQNAYTIARAFLDLASTALQESYGGTPPRRFVGMGELVHDVPDQLAVHLTNVAPSPDFQTKLVVAYTWNYVLSITRAYPGQPGDGDVIEHEDLDAASKIHYEDIDLVMTALLCGLPFAYSIDGVTPIEPLGGVSGWTVQLSVLAA